jgi:hypothetical protein
MLTSATFRVGYVDTSNFNVFLKCIHSDSISAYKAPNTKHTHFSYHIHSTLLNVHSQLQSLNLHHISTVQNVKPWPYAQLTVSCRVSRPLSSRWGDVGDRLVASRVQIGGPVSEQLQLAQLEANLVAEQRTLAGLLGRDLDGRDCYQSN